MCLLAIYMFSYVKYLYKYFVHLKSLVVWRLPWKSIAGSLGSIPGQGTKIPYAAQGGKKRVVLSY